MPSQDNENAMDGLLRRSLARDSAARGDCPDAELLAAYFDQALGADEAAGYELHFSTCTRCREQLAAMVRANAGQQLYPADLALEPALAGARPVQAIALDAARIPAQAKPAASGARSETKFPERKSPDARWLDLRWLIPVAAMLVLGTFVFMRYASHETTVGVNSQVAMSKSTPPPQDQTAARTRKESHRHCNTREDRAESPTIRNERTVSLAIFHRICQRRRCKSARKRRRARPQRYGGFKKCSRRDFETVASSWRSGLFFSVEQTSRWGNFKRNGSGIPEGRIRTRPSCSRSGVECVNGKNSCRRGLGRRCEISRARAASASCNKNTRFRTRRPKYQWFSRR